MASQDCACSLGDRKVSILIRNLYTFCVNLRDGMCGSVQKGGMREVSNLPILGLNMKKLCSHNISVQTWGISVSKI
jgi:hypothetical protein